MSILSDNLKKARLAAGFTSQEKAAAVLKIKRSTLASYEEARATPSLHIFPRLVDAFQIRDWKGFISNPNWDPAIDSPTSGEDLSLQKYNDLVRQIKYLAKQC